MKWLINGVIFLVIFSVTRAAPTSFAVDSSLRLPQTSFPVRYDLSITTAVHNGNRAFSGIAQISIEVKVATNVITLHNRGLVIGTINFQNSADEFLHHTIRIESEKEFMHIESATQLPIGQYKIEILYSSQLNLDPTGFYISSYRAGGVTR
jgi:hypothetical protein